VVLGETLRPKTENVGTGMMKVITITLNTKEGRQMAETPTVCVIKRELNLLAAVGIRIERIGIGNTTPDMSETGTEQETEMIPQVVVVTEMIDIITLGKSLGHKMIVEDLGETQGKGITGTVFIYWFPSLFT
jgi:hypothetical protein